MDTEKLGNACFQNRKKKKLKIEKPVIIEEPKKQRRFRSEDKYEKTENMFPSLFEMNLIEFFSRSMEKKKIKKEDNKMMRTKSIPVSQPKKQELMKEIDKLNCRKSKSQYFPSFSGQKVIKKKPS